MDLGTWLCDPPAMAISKFFRFNLALGARRAENFQLADRYIDCS